MLASTGEQVTIALLAIALEERGVPAVNDYWQVPVRNDSSFGKARKS